MLDIKVDPLFHSLITPTILIVILDTQLYTNSCKSCNVYHVIYMKITASQEETLYKISRLMLSFMSMKSLVKLNVLQEFCTYFAEHKNKANKLIINQYVMDN